MLIDFQLSAIRKQAQAYSADPEARLAYECGLLTARVRELHQALQDLRRETSAPQGATPMRWNGLDIEVWSER